MTEPSRRPDRRECLRGAALLGAASLAGMPHARRERFSMDALDEQIAERVRELRGGRSVTLHLLLPNGMRGQRRARRGGVHGADRRTSRIRLRGRRRHQRDDPAAYLLGRNRLRRRAARDLRTSGPDRGELPREPRRVRGGVRAGRVPGVVALLARRLLQGQPLRVSDRWGLLPRLLQPPHARGRGRASPLRGPARLGAQGRRDVGGARCADGAFPRPRSRALWWNALSNRRLHRLGMVGALSRQGLSPVRRELRAADRQRGGDRRAARAVCGFRAPAPRSRG